MAFMVYGIDSTIKFASQPGVQMQRGFLIPEEDERHYRDNMGRTLESYQEETQGLDDVLINFQGVDALVSAGHHQFVCPKEVLQQALPAEFGTQLMGRMIELDETVDRMGYLRLSTPRPVTRLLGNVISEKMAIEAKTHGLVLKDIAHIEPSARGMERLYRRPFVRRIAQAIYNRMYRILNA
jgi:hypothetical protein